MGHLRLFPSYEFFRAQPLGLDRLKTFRRRLGMLITIIEAGLPIRHGTQVAWCGEVEQIISAPTQWIC